jgi:glucokinase
MKTLGLDLGGTKIAAAVVEEGRILDRHLLTTPQSGFAEVLTALLQAARILLDRHTDVAAIGLGSPGPLDYASGKILFAPNIPGLENAPIGPALEQEMGCPVMLENDANAAGFAEHLYGAARNLESSLYITISTGIGGGLFLGDHVIRGASGIAGEIGHMTVLIGGPMGGDGHLGSLESIASGRAIARDGSYSYGLDLTTEEVFERARDGEHKAVDIIENAARFTGIGIANLVKIFNPEGFVIGGGMSKVGRFYLDRIQDAADSYLHGYPKAKLYLAELGTDAGVIGAASIAGR